MSGGVDLPAVLYRFLFLGFSNFSITFCSDSSIGLPGRTFILPDGLPTSVSSVHMIFLLVEQCFIFNCTGSELFIIETSRLISVVLRCLLAVKVHAGLDIAF